MPIGSNAMECTLVTRLIWCFQDPRGSLQGSYAPWREGSVWIGTLGTGRKKRERERGATGTWSPPGTDSATRRTATT